MIKEIVKKKPIPIKIKEEITHDHYHHHYKHTHPEVIHKGSKAHKYLGTGSLDSGSGSFGSSSSGVGSGSASFEEVGSRFLDGSGEDF